MVDLTPPASISNLQNSNDVYFGTSTTPALVSNDQVGTTFDPGTLNYSTTYYWKGIATDNHGASTSGPLWDFTTSPASASTGAVSDTITSTNNGTGIAGVTVNLSGFWVEICSGN